MARLEGYSFGRIVGDGEEHTRDLIVLPGRVVPDWWRREGHSLAMEDLDEVRDELPERLILGCGAHGQLRPDPAARVAVLLVDCTSGLATRADSTVQPEATAARHSP